MNVRIYNTLTHKKEVLETLEPGKVKMYVCGPTVYNKAHVGHAMSAVVFDIIKRYLIYRGYEVRHLMNFTDVDDKIINRANQMGRDPFELANSYIVEFQKNMADLNILPATFNPRATQTIPQIIKMVQGLVEKGFAYPVEADEAHNSDVYFRVTRDEDYGRLSGRKLDEMQAGSRIEVDDRKEHPMDFALWKAAKPGEPFWESPWGKGRPGWHIECSAMNLEHMGEQIDIHGGGNDLVFPHHENEIAQSESLTGKTFAHYWAHNGMLQMSGEKMSKSLGNIVSIEAFLVDHGADVLRLMVLNSGYRNPLTFNDEVIDQTKRALERLHSALRPALPNAGGANETILLSLKTQMEATQTGFTDSMDDDFNSAGALGYLFELVRVVNQARADSANAGELEPAQNLLRQLTGVLGLRLEKIDVGGQAANPFIELLIDMRTQARAQKQYAISDQIRDRLMILGVALEDSKDGTTWRWQ
jgi:cysteinyl-tRNA synthetase